MLKNLKESVELGKHFNTMGIFLSSEKYVGTSIWKIMNSIVSIPRVS
jgi:hypothetical protein